VRPEALRAHVRTWNDDIEKKLHCGLTSAVQSPFSRRTTNKEAEKVGRVNLIATSTAICLALANTFQKSKK
jgi:hypothetical protein